MSDPIVPPASDYEHQILSWAHEAIQEGEAFLKSQKGFNKISDSIAAIMGEDASVQSSKLSGTSINHTAKVALDLAASLTDVKPFWEYKTSNKRFEKHTKMLGKLSTHWWQNRFIDLKFCEALKYALVAGTGWSHLFFNFDTLDIDISAEDPRDVLPIRPNSNISIQECMGVIHRRSRTVNYVRSQWPKKAHLIQADRDGSAVSYSLANTRTGRLLDKIGSPFRDYLFGHKPAAELPRIPTVDLNTMYIRDDSINKSGHVMFMGEFDKDGVPLNNWSYTVQPNEPLYPRKRCIIFTSTCVLYDGPSMYWHGLFPYCKLTLDPWPWSWLGKSPLWDIYSVQFALNKTMRCIDDWLEKVVRPDVIADKNSVAKAELDRIDTRKAGLKIRHNPMAGKGIQIVPPPQLPPELFNIVEYYEEKLYELPGARDLTQLMRLNQMPSPDTVEKILEAMSPSVRLRSRVMEVFMREFAAMTAFNFAQFYPLSKRLNILGEEGATEQDFDVFDSDSFIPQFTDSDYTDGVPSPESLARGPLPRHERARKFFDQVSYHISPSSLLAASEIERKLLYLQLARAGWVDIWTLFEVLDIPNAGEPPPGADTIPQRLAAMMMSGINMAENSAGRKASGQDLPRMTTKDGGSRTTTKES